MTDRISAVQLFILLTAGKLAGLILYPGVTDTYVSLFSFIPAIIIYSMMVYFLIIPSSMRNKISGLLSARYPERWLSFFFSLYFMYMVFLRLYRFYRFAQLNTTEGLSPLFITLFILTAAVYAATSGSEAVARFSGFVFFSFLICSVPLIYLMLQTFDPGSLTAISKGTTGDTVWCLQEIISESDDLALMFILSSSASGKFRRTAMLWNTFILISFLFFLIIVGGSVIDYIEGTDYPIYKITDSASFLQRTAPVFVMITILCIICLISAELYVVMKLPDNFAFSGKQKNFFIIIIAAAVYGGALLVIFFSGLRDAVYSEKVRFIITMLFSLVVPLISFAVMIIKERKVRA